AVLKMLRPSHLAITMLHKSNFVKNLPVRNCYVVQPQSMQGRKEPCYFKKNDLVPTGHAVDGAEETSGALDLLKTALRLWYMAGTWVKSIKIPLLRG
ncbi:hypothetical protein M9458_003288, partial [Cirrhinus mrigala]